MSRAVALKERVRYRLLDHVADLGMEVRGASLEDLFVEAARALFDVIGSLETTEARTEERILVEGEGQEELLRAWLSELLFLSAARGMVYSEFTILSLDSGRLEALARGEPCDASRHRVEREIKAVTFHGLEITRDHRGWRATVIFDI
jgi:SHS2 domain-containing protein